MRYDYFYGKFLSMQWDFIDMTKVLVIEDERYLLEDITELLQYTDFEVQGASSGTEGLNVSARLRAGLDHLRHHDA